MEQPESALPIHRLRFLNSHRDTDDPDQPLMAAQTSDQFSDSDLAYSQRQSIQTNHEEIERLIQEAKKPMSLDRSSNTAETCDVYSGKNFLKLPNDKQTGLIFAFARLYSSGQMSASYETITDIISQCEPHLKFNYKNLEDISAIGQYKMSLELLYDILWKKLDMEKKRNDEIVGGDLLLLSYYENLMREHQQLQLETDSIKLEKGKIIEEWSAKSKQMEQSYKSLMSVHVQVQQKCAKLRASLDQSQENNIGQSYKIEELTNKLQEQMESHRKIECQNIELQQQSRSLLHQLELFESKKAEYDQLLSDFELAKQKCARLMSELVECKADNSWQKDRISELNQECDELVDIITEGYDVQINIADDNQLSEFHLYEEEGHASAIKKKKKRQRGNKRRFIKEVIREIISMKQIAQD